ncbi:hypothetical protein [Methanoplanus endosymbiosus]|uniref:Lipoprotein n=1 Tax=Methanoplanus endosymbiosus TaxID=33865 RepID=A0A9E7PPI3_9EURY|nr:hypothetical protein [Methanoplanus endosymbiosus]UUX92496.1 hypothetical protein L6E24_14370 [Methanoplanus endosymbiosus]
MMGGLKTFAVVITLLFISFTLGCVSGISEKLITDSDQVTGSDYQVSDSVKKNTDGIQKSSAGSVPEATSAAGDESVSAGSSEKTVVDLRTASSSSSASSSKEPKFTAGTIISNDDGDKLLITVYKEISNKYCTRAIHYSGSHYYLYKDGSFKELGSNYDYVQNIEKMYPNEVSKNQYVDIYVKDTDKKIGCLFPGNDETMNFNGY